MKRYRLFCVAVVLALAAVAGCSNNQDQVLKQKQAEAIRGVGEALMAEGNYTAALRKFMEAEQLYANDHLLYDDFGLAYMAKGRYPEAIASFEKALRLQPDYAPGRNNLAVAYMKTGEYEKAVAIFKDLADDVLYATPQFPLYNLGRIYFSRREFGRAEAYFQDALDVAPNFVEAQRWVGRTCMATGRWAEAVEEYQKAIQKAPTYYLLYYDLAEAYRVLGDVPNAVSAYQKVLELAPPDADIVRSVNANLRTLQQSP